MVARRVSTEALTPTLGWRRGIPAAPVIRAVAKGCALWRKPVR
jgi:hypothetical protein